jgi:hypothetical protein
LELKLLGSGSGEKIYEELGKAGGAAHFCHSSYYAHHFEASGSYDALEQELLVSGKVEETH